MDFSVPGSDSWGSSPSEELFIQSYFYQDGTCPKIKKRKRGVEVHKVNGKDLAATGKDHCVTKKPKMKLKNSPLILNKLNIQKSEFVSDVKETCNQETLKTKVTSKATERNFKKKLKKKIKKTMAKNITSSTQQTSIHERESEQVAEKNAKIKQNVLNKFITDSDLNLLDNTFDVCIDADDKRKKVNKMKASSKKPNQSDKIKDFQQGKDTNSNSSESVKVKDEDMKEEIVNSDEYKKIQRLMEKIPQLNPHYSGEPGDDEDIDSISVESWSSIGGDSMSDFDDSAEEIDSKCSQESDNYSSVRFTKNIMEGKRTKDSNAKSIENAYEKQMNVVNNKHRENIRSSFKNKAQERLQSAKFRFLNEKLYTETGNAAFKYFQENVEEFEDYHLGYSLQVSKWPLNPVDQIISDLKEMTNSIVIADMGCGEAKIAQTFPEKTVHSYDFIAINEHVTACDVSKVPLRNGSADVVVFCLSLMGTNLKDYLCEAFRILKMGGTLKIAEVESRIEDLDDFIKKIKSIGFSLQNKITQHKLFVFLDFNKEKKKLKSAKIPCISLKPCLYKKR